MITGKIGEQIKIWLMYQRDNIIVSGLTNLTIDIKNINNISYLSNGVMIENINNLGEYIYLFTIPISIIDSYLYIYYKQSGNLLAIESLIINIAGDDPESSAL
jgi:hypothetical protein